MTLTFPGKTTGKTGPRTLIGLTIQDHMKTQDPRRNQDPYYPSY